MTLQALEHPEVREERRCPDLEEREAEEVAVFARDDEIGVALGDQCEHTRRLPLVLTAWRARMETDGTACARHDIPQVDERMGERPVDRRVAFHLHQIPPQGRKVCYPPPQGSTVASGPGAAHDAPRAPPRPPRRDHTMQPLTAEVWERHFTELRPHILDHYSQVDRQELENVRGDWDGLVALVQRATNLSADSTRQALRTMDVEELGLGTGGDGGERQGAGLDQLSLGTGFGEAERDRIVDRLSQLGRHLRRFPPDATYLELSVKDRESTGQVVTLEAEMPGFPRFVTKSKENDLRAALADVRDDMIDQINRAVGKRTEGGR